MDRIDRLRQEAENELARIHSKHEKEWEEILEESKAALSSAETAREVKKISEEYKKRMEVLRKKQHDELLKVQRDFTQSLLSM